MKSSKTLVQHSMVYMLEEYDVHDNNTISITIPEELEGYSGVYDIRVTNRCSGCVDIDKEKHPKLNELKLGSI